VVLSQHFFDVFLLSVSDVDLTTEPSTNSKKKRQARDHFFGDFDLMKHESKINWFGGKKVWSRIKEIWRRARIEAGWTGASNCVAQGSNGVEEMRDWCSASISSAPINATSGRDEVAISRVWAAT
jgi:hypothetical protein